MLLLQKKHVYFPALMWTNSNLRDLTLYSHLHGYEACKTLRLYKIKNLKSEKKNLSICNPSTRNTEDILGKSKDSLAYLVRISLGYNKQDLNPQCWSPKPRALCIHSTTEHTASSKQDAVCLFIDSFFYGALASLELTM